MKNVVLSSFQIIMYCFSLINIFFVVLIITTIVSVSSLFVPMDRVNHPDQYEFSPIYYRFHPKKTKEIHDERIEEDERDDKRRSSHTSSALFPRANRNAWFRIATYQNYKPVNSEEAMSTENPMRWGR